MKKFFSDPLVWIPVVGILVALLLVAIQARAGEPMYTAQIVDTGPRMCHINTPSIEQSVGNTQTIYVKRVVEWVGAMYGFRGDVASTLWLGSVEVFREGYDHYSDGSHIREIDLGGDYIALEPWDTFRFNGACDGFAHGGPVHWQVKIFYTTVKP